VREWNHLPAPCCQARDLMSMWRSLLCSSSFIDQLCGPCNLCNNIFQKLPPREVKMITHLNFLLGLGMCGFLIYISVCLHGVFLN
jgi:hypothetical protein